MLGRLLRSSRPPAARSGAVGVFFDIENCTPPRWVSAAKLVMSLRNLTRPFGPVSFIKLYQDSKSASRHLSGFLEKASRSGIEVRDCPHSGDKEVSDRHIMTDLAAFALDHPPPATVVLMSSDHDFAPMLNMLRNRHYQVVLIEGQRQTKPALRVAADVVFGFEDIMGRSHLLSQLPKPLLPLKPTPPPTMAARCRQFLRSFFALKEEAAQPIEVDGSTQHVPTNFRPAPTDQTLFHPLIAALTLPEFRRPLVPQVSVSRAILSRDPAAFTRAGCSSHGQYFAAAQAAGLVILGAGPANAYEWMTLTPTLQVLVSDFSYVDLATATAEEQILAAGMPASKASRLRLLPPTNSNSRGDHSGSGAPVRPASERIPKAFWRWEKERRKKAMRAATAAMASISSSAAGLDASGTIVSPGLAAVLGAREAAAVMSDEIEAESGQSTSFVSSAVPSAEPLDTPATSPAVDAEVVAPALSSPNVLAPFRQLTSTLRRPPTSFTRNPPLEPLPAELFAPLAAVLNRPHIQDAVLLALSRSGEAEEAMRRVGAADWREYVARAEVSGVVELGRDGQARDRWISLLRRSSPEEPSAVTEDGRTEAVVENASP